MAFEKIGVRAVIEGLSRFNRDARIINRRLKEVTRGLKDTERSSRATGRGMETFGKKLDKVSSDLLVLGGALTAVGVAGSAFLFSATQLAARVETLGIVTVTLGKNIGKTEQEIRDLEQAVRSQGITLQGSRQAIALMIQSNIDLGNATDLARIAQNAAVIANVNSTEAFQRLVFVITSGNVRMARTLGLQVSFQRAYKATAESLGKTTLELTELEKVQARTNAVMAASVNIIGAYDAAMETVGKKVLSLDRHLETARMELGEQWLPIYGAAVDLVTSSLVWWTELDDRWQRVIGSGILLVATTGSVAGGLLLFTAALGKLIPALIKVSGLIGVSAGTLGLMALAIGAVVAAGVMFVNFISDVAAKVRQLDGIISDHTEQLIRGAGSYEDYRKEVERVNEVIDQQGALGKLLTRGIAELTEEEFNAAREALVWRDAQLGATSAMEGSETAAGEAAQSFEDMAEAEAKARDEAEKLERSQNFLKEALDEVQLTIRTDVTEQFGDFESKLEDINQTITDLETERIEAIAELEFKGLEEAEEAEERIGDLNDRIANAKIRLRELGVELQIARIRLSEMNEETSEASRLAAEARIDRLTTDISQQKDAISELNGEIGELNEGVAGMADVQAEKLAELETEYIEKMGAARSEIEETTKAWERQTAEIIFNLATQRLGIGGFTREEIKALTTLAGPEGLGLIDEAAVAMLEKIDEANLAMEMAGDQSGLFAEDLSTLAGVMSDPTIQAENLAAAIRDIDLSIVEFQQRHPRGFFPTILQRPGGAFGASRQRGGGLRGGQAALVGERGPEIFMPRQSGLVLPNKLFSAMTSMVNAVASAIPSAAPSTAAMAAGGGTTEQVFNQTINTAAPVEPIIADFHLLALMGERRG